MIRLIFLIILLAGSVLLGLALNQEPGYVLISTRAWTIETPLWVAVILLITSLFLLHLGYLMLRLLYKAPASLRAWLYKHKQYQAQARTRQGLIEFSEGYWQAAQTHLIKALPNTDIPLFNYLTAARTAQELGQTQIRDHYLREAQHIEPKANIAVKLTQAQLQITSQQWEQALATLQHLHDLAPKHPYVLKLLTQLYETVKDWPALLRLLPSLKKYGGLSAQQFEARQHRFLLESFQEQCKHQPALEIIKTAFKALPKSYQHDPAFLIPYCHYLASQEHWQLANQLIKQALSQQLNDALIKLYTTLPEEEDKLIFVKNLIKSHPHSAELHFCLGRLNLNARLFGQAKTHFELCLAIHPQPAVYFYLGETVAWLGSDKEAAALFKQGLQMTLNPDNTICPT